MSWDINKVVLIGRLSSDVEVKYTPSGSAVARFGLAVGGKPKPDGSDSVSFFNIVVWGKTGENCGQFLSKGKQVALDGRLEQRSWTAQDGSRRSTVEVIADRVEFLTPSGGGARPAGNSGAQGASGGSKPAPAYEDTFYDNTNFDSTPLDPGFIDEGHGSDGPNF